ncbi:MAG: transporter substrate-binding domain-containing protein [Desulfobacterales bacterium]
MKSLFFLVLIILLCLIYFPTMAGNIPGEIIFASEERSKATNRDGTGLYWDILRAVYGSEGIKTKIITKSNNRSVNLVRQRKADAAVGTYPEPNRGTVCSRYPFVKDYVLVLFKKNKFSPWDGQQSLKNRKVAWIKGHSYDEYLGVPVVKKEFDTREAILRRLDHDQIDFFMDTRNDMESVLNKGIIDITHYTVERVMELERYLVFANNNKGKRLKKIFDFRFPALVKTGEIDRLYDKWNW